MSARISPSEGHPRSGPPNHLKPRGRTLRLLKAAGNAGIRRASKRVRGGRHPAPHLHRSCRQSSNKAGLLDACLRVDIYQGVLVSSHSFWLCGSRTLAPWRGRFGVRALFPHTARIIRDLLRAGMSVHRRIPDAAPSGAEGRRLTQLGHRRGAAFNFRRYPLPTREARRPGRQPHPSHHLDARCHPSRVGSMTRSSGCG